MHDGPLKPLHICLLQSRCREALQQFSARQLRLMFIMSPWNKTISYGETMRAEMRARESALKNFFQNVDVAIREGSRDESSTSGKWQVGVVGPMHEVGGGRMLKCTLILR